MLRYNIDPNIRYGKVEELLYHIPRTVTVNKFDEEAAAKFALEVQTALNTKQKVLPIVIDSYGGQVYSLLSMVDTLNQVPKDITVVTIAKGKSMSCGAVLFTQGHEGHRYMAPNATLMIHDVSSGSHGKTEEIKADAKETDRLNNLIYSMMAKGCGKKEKYFWKLVHEMGRSDWFLDANEAKKHNIANHIRVPSFKMSVKCEVEFE